MTTNTAIAWGRAAGVGAAALLVAVPLTAALGSSAAIAAPTKKSTVVTLKASGAVTFPAKVSLTGKLTTASGKSLAARQVKVLSRASGATSWKVVAKAKTTGKGTYSVKASASRTSQFKVTFAGSSTYRADSSPVRTTKVNGKIAISVPSTVQVHNDVTVTGSFAPARPGRTVKLQEFYNGAWHNVLTTKLDASSRYSFAIHFMGESTAKLRVVSAAASDLGAASSAVRTVTAVTGTTPPPPASECGATPWLCENPPPPPLPPGTGGTGQLPW